MAEIQKGPEPTPLVRVSTASPDSPSYDFDLLTDQAFDPARDAGQDVENDRLKLAFLHSRGRVPRYGTRLLVG